MAQHYPRQYAIYIRICQLAVNSRVTEFPKWFIMEIDSEKNETLVEGLGHHFLPMYCFCGGKWKKLNMVINRATSTKKLEYISDQYIFSLLQIENILIKPLS